MKRVILIMFVAMLGISATFAKDESTNSIERYDMSVNIRQLGTCLGLTVDQMKSVDEYYTQFCSAMFDAAYASADEKGERISTAVSENAKRMKYILNSEQYKKYIKLINATFENRGFGSYMVK